MSELASGDISYWRKYNDFCPNCGVEFSKMHPAANLIPHYYGECTNKKQCPPKSPNQEILEAIAALADGMRARDRQLSALSEQIRVGLGGPSVSNPTGISLHETLKA